MVEDVAGLVDLAKRGTTEHRRHPFRGCSDRCAGHDSGGWRAGSDRRSRSPSNLPRARGRASCRRAMWTSSRRPTRSTRRGASATPRGGLATNRRLILLTAARPGAAPDSGHSLGCSRTNSCSTVRRRSGDQGRERHLLSEPAGGGSIPSAPRATVLTVPTPCGRPGAVARPADHPPRAVQSNRTRRIAPLRCPATSGSRRVV